jgi:hypothetical protein
MSQCKMDNLVELYHDQELDPRWVAEIERHVNSCASCAGHLADLRQMSGILSGVTVTEIRSDERERLHAAVYRTESRDSERFILRMAISLASIAAMVLIVTSLFLVRSVGRTRGESALASTPLPMTADFQQVSLGIQADSRLPAWMLRGLGGESP